jgi:chemotaxis signal transduction protein
MPEAHPSSTDGVVSRAVLIWLGGQCCTVPADQVVKVVPSHQLTPLPLLPAEVAGVIAVGGKVVPVLELHTMLDLPESGHRDGELVLIALGAETYALRVDRAVQIAANTGMDTAVEHETPARRIDIDALLKRRLWDGTAARTAFASLDVAESAPAVPPQTLRLGVGQAALAVETARSHDLLPLEIVVEICETVPIAAVPDPAPIFAGAAFYRDALVPVLSLDALLGRATTSEDAGGCFVVVDVDGRRCALAVKRVLGLSLEVGPERVVQLQPLLANVLPEFGSGQALTKLQGARAQEAIAAETRYLLVELAGRICAFALASVAHIHAGCRVVKTPAEARSIAVGITAIGGRVLPVLDLAALLGLETGPSMQQFIELKSQETGAFVIAIDRVVGVVAIGQDALVPPPDGTAISAVARLGADLVWILAASLIAERGGWRTNAA